MAFEIIPLTQAYPTSQFGESKWVAHLLAHTGVECFHATHFLLQSVQETMPIFSVHLSLMHKCIELLAKALVVGTDWSTTPKQHGHKVFEMMEKYKETIPVFAAIIADPVKKDHILQLEKAYFAVRYGEAYFSAHDKDVRESLSIAEELIDAYHNLTGVPLIPKHFATQTSLP